MQEPCSNPALCLSPPSIPSLLGSGYRFFAHAGAGSGWWRRHSRWRRVAGPIPSSGVMGIVPLPPCGWGLGGWTVASNPCGVELASASGVFILGLKQVLHLAAPRSAEMHQTLTCKLACLFFLPACLVWISDWMTQRWKRYPLQKKRNAPHRTSQEDQKIG